MPCALCIVNPNASFNGYCSRVAMSLLNRGLYTEKQHYKHEIVNISFKHL